VETIRISGLVNESIVDGPGIRFVIFSQGCPHNCEGCHNPDTHDFEGGSDIKLTDLKSKIKQNPIIDGITLSGGEPFCQAEGFAKLAIWAKEEGYTVVAYSGYTFEQLLKMSKEDKWIEEMLLNVDLLIDGRFEKNQQDYTLKFRGSRNQRMILVYRSMQEKKIIEFEEE
jgi:anaerobic ribonucleoside-triphosphate reductase activating protein